MQISTEKMLDLYRGSLKSLIHDDRDAFIAILRKNGVDFPADATDDQLYAAILVGMVHSFPFKNDINEFVKQNAVGNYANASGGGRFVNYVDDYFSNFVNADAGSDPSAAPANDSLLKQTLTPQRLGSYFDAAANLLVSAIGNKMQQKGEQNAIDYELAQAKKFDSVAQAGKATSTASAQKKILVPVLIGVSVLLIGGIAWYMFTQAKKKAK